MADAAAAPDPMTFANEVGQALWGYLEQQAHLQLATASDQDRFTALITAARIPLGEVIRQPLEGSRDRAAMADRLVGATARQLRALLQEVVDRQPG